MITVLKRNLQTVKPSSFCWFCMCVACMNAWIHTFFGGQEVSSTLHPLYRGGVSRLNTGLARTTSLASQLGLGGTFSLPPEH